MHETAKKNFKTHNMKIDFTFKSGVDSYHKNFDILIDSVC